MSSDATPTRPEWAVTLGPVVGRHVVPPAAFLVQPQPPAQPLPELVLPPHPGGRTHPREAVDSTLSSAGRPPPGATARMNR